MDLNKADSCTYQMQYYDYYLLYCHVLCEAFFNKSLNLNVKCKVQVLFRSGTLLAVRYQKIFKGVCYLTEFSTYQKSRPPESL